MTAHLRKHREQLSARQVESPLPLLPAFLEAHPGPLPGSGRGIVTSASPAYHCAAYVLFRLLRHVGCTLPIECWYLGESERDDRFADLVAPLGVTMVDALARGFELIDERPSFEANRGGKLSSYTPTAVNGYAVKPFAILHSAFQEVLWLDADNCPASDPAGLFASMEYSQTGAIFWPDAAHRRLTRKACQAFGVAWRDEREFETGQIVLDKARCREALLTTWFLNLHRAWSYRFAWGDKDTFQVAWWKAAAEYFVAPNAGGGSGVFVQHDPAGKPLFWHRSMGTKYTPQGDVALHCGFPLHNVALHAVQQWKQNLRKSQVLRRQIRLAAFDRPHYLRETLAHLKRCRGLEAFQIVASVDARPDGTHNREVVDLCRQVTGDVRLRPRLGCNKHTHVNLQEAAGEADWLFLLEDDIILAREALEWCLANEENLYPSGKGKPDDHGENSLPDRLRKIPYRSRRSEVSKSEMLTSRSLPDSMCLIGHKAASATDRREELAVWDYFCAWGMYFSPAGVRKALELWQPEWDDKPRLTWDCYLSDAGWLQLMPWVPRAKNIGRLGFHCKTEQDFSDADRQHWIDDGWEAYPPSPAEQIKAAVTPWPLARPPFEFNDFGWLQPEVAAELQRRVADASLVVELGSFLGKSARFILDNSRANLIAVDTWLGSPELIGHETMSQWGADLFERFQANCWNYRERLTVVRHTTSAALRYFAKVGLRPDLIYVDASHQREDACLDVTLCRRLFPDAVLVGDDWMWETVQQGLSDAGLVPTSTEGTCWVYDPLAGR
jgi:hypothetical protein